MVTITLELTNAQLLADISYQADALTIIPHPDFKLQIQAPGSLYNFHAEKCHLKRPNAKDMT